MQKRSSPRLARSKTIRETADLDVLENKIAHYAKPPRPRKRTPRFIADSASDSDHDTDMDGDDADDEHDEFGELSDLTGDNVQYNASDQLDRRESYDSRLDSGNEDYELDDFVVGDESSDAISEMGSEITVTQEIVDEQRRCLSEVSGDVDMDRVTASSRKASATSSDSGLFVSDPHDPPSALPPYLAPLPPPFLQPLSGDVESADVAEEIMDALCRFSRRCNRDCAPLRLVLTSEVFEDEEVGDVVKCAIKQGMGKCEEVGDGSGAVRVEVGPKR